MRMRDRIEKAYKVTKGTKGGDGDSREAGETSSAGRGDGTPQAGGAPSRTPSKEHAPARDRAPKGGSPRGRRAEEARRSFALGDAVAAAESEATALLKTGSESGVSKAAKFLLLLGTDEAAKVIAHLGPAEVETVSREILKVKSMDAIEANEILAEFGWLVKTKGWSIEGGPETAEKMLSAAFGSERARALLRKAAPEALRPFRFLNDFEPKDLHLILKEESSQVLAVILPYIEPKRASGLIERLPEEQRVEVVKRVARLEKVNPEVLHQVEEGLKERIRRIGSIATEELDGKAALAGILRHVDPRLEERVLSALEEESPELSKNVRDRLFTLEDVLRVPDRYLQNALRDFQERDIALILKGRDDDFKEKVLRNVSANRRTMIVDEYSILGAVRREDADEAAREFLSYLKRAWEDGELVLEGEDELVS